MKDIKLFLKLAVLIFSVWGCDKLEYSEFSDYSQEYIFSDPTFTANFLSNIYDYLPTDFSSIDGAMRSSASDDAIHVDDLATVHKFNDGSWNAIQKLDEQWSRMYSGIRASNLFIEEMKKARTFDELRYNDGYAQTMSSYRLYPYEARFLRAFFYFELIKRYGDVPLVTKVLTKEEANTINRTPFDEVVKFIVEECDSAAAKLPETYESLAGAETGRITKNAARALKSRTLLYAASPLFNPSNDKNKWIAAAKAAKDMIDAPSWANSLPGQFANVVNNLAARGLILERRQAASSAFEAANTAVGFEGGNTGTCPTQNLVDAFEMQATGLGINEPGSGYNPLNPYAGRDPRMGHTVLFDGALWKTLPVEVWDGGKNGPPQRFATKTGYYLKKYMIEAVSLSPTAPSTRIHYWILFRFGEVMLNYAEAMNEAYGPNTPGPAPLQLTAIEAVNQLRSRVAMPAYPVSLTQEGFRQKIRNERRVEFAFEDHRFWDLRRWKIGPQTTDIYGMTVAKNTSGGKTYTKFLVQKRVWDDKMYLYPIPQNEIFINQSLTQNTGW